MQDLISLASKGDFHPQAVLAAEQFGASLIASPLRLAEAVDCLSGNDSAELESIGGIYVGLTSGGTKQLVRNSTALQRMFLLCSACKLCYLDDEIGSLIFEMAVGLKLLEQHPVFSYQLFQFIKQISGHCESIVPMDMMHEIASTVMHPALNVAFLIG